MQEPNYPQEPWEDFDDYMDRMQRQAEDAIFPDHPEHPASVLPETVDFPLIERALCRVGFHYELRADKKGDRYEIPWPGYSMAISIEKDITRLVVAEVTMYGFVDFSEINALADAINDWNQNSIDPPAHLRIDDDARVRVGFRCSVAVDRGLSEAQLTSFLGNASDAASMAANFFATRFPALDGEITTGPVEPEKQIDPWDSDVPSEVTVERIQAALAAMGVTKVRELPNMLVAWVNEILLAFCIERGPTLLVNGPWYHKFNVSEDFMRCFLVCNEWNEENHFAKAFCQTDPDDPESFHIRTEFVLDIRQGLNDNQLAQIVSLGLREPLKALDAISKEVTGVSAVGWPQAGD